MMISQDAAALNSVLARIQSTTKPPGENLYLIDIDPVDML
jgi:hypothetical protein